MMKCWECGERIKPSRRRRFCAGNACRKAWNNRRMSRGAVIYDMFMAMRFERETAEELGVWSALCRQAANWRETDIGLDRRSYPDIRPIMAARPDLKTIRGYV